MNKIDQLFIRACKSYEPTIRLRSVYRRFYLSGRASEKVYEGAVISILSRICDKYVPFRSEDLIEQLDPDHWISRELESYNKRVLRAIIYQIRMSPVASFPNLTSPRKFR